MFILQPPVITPPLINDQRTDQRTQYDDDSPQLRSNNVGEPTGDEIVDQIQNSWKDAGVTSDEDEFRSSGDGFHPYRNNIPQSSGLSVTGAAGYLFRGAVTTTSLAYAGQQLGTTASVINAISKGKYSSLFANTPYLKNMIETIK